MTASLARNEIRRFLTNDEPEVLSITGRWGVGKTYAWSQELSVYRQAANFERRRYSYVSAFVLPSIKDLKEAVFQSTIRLDGSDVQPTVDSLRENLKSIEGVTRLAEWGGRRLTKASSSLLSLVPWAGSAGELILPTASLLIKDQIICIDDLERAGEGLDLIEILGFASQMKELRNCKVVLLLNKEGLADNLPNYERYLEKTADQAIVFEPSPDESARIALSEQDPPDAELAKCVIKLGITNIRVIRRIRKFLSHIEPRFAAWHEDTIKQAIQSLALFGWSIFEPEFAPSVSAIRSYNRYQGLFDDDAATDEGRSVLNHLMQSYGFSGVDDFDEVLISGVQKGAFDVQKLETEAESLNIRFRNAEARNHISEPWNLFGGSFEDNSAEIEAAIRAAVDGYAGLVQPSEINSFYELLCDLGRDQAAEEVLSSYMEQQVDRPRGFFEPSSHPSFSRRANANVLAAFEAALAERPLERNPVEVLSGIETNSGWDPEDIGFLASLTSGQLVELYKSLECEQLRIIIMASLRFVDANSGPESYQQFGGRVRRALETIAEESDINAMRVRGYLGGAE